MMFDESQPFQQKISLRNLSLSTYKRIFGESQLSLFATTYRLILEGALPNSAFPPLNISQTSLLLILQGVSSVSVERRVQLTAQQCGAGLRRRAPSLATGATGFLLRTCSQNGGILTSGMLRRNGNTRSIFVSHLALAATHVLRGCSVSGAPQFPQPVW